jgi:hypothetical protein
MARRSTVTARCLRIKFAVESHLGDWSNQGRQFRSDNTLLVRIAGAAPRTPTSVRVADHTDEGSGVDSQKPVVNDNVLYHSLSGLAS